MLQVSLISKNKKILWLVEHRDLELDLINCHLGQLRNVTVDIVSIKYWMFLPDFLRYDLIVTPFLPSRPSSHCALIEEALLAGVSVVVLNWWQSFSMLEMDYRKNSLKYFVDYPLYVYSWKNDYTQYLVDLGYKNQIIKGPFHADNILKFKLTKRDTEKIKKTIFISIDFGLSFAGESIRKYRIGTGFKEQLYDQKVELDKIFLIDFIRSLINLSKHNPTAKIILSGYPSTHLTRFRKKLEATIGTLPHNIDLDVKGNTSKNLIECDFLVTNVPDLSRSKASIGGASLVYKPPNIIRYFTELDLEGLSTVSDLSYPVEEIFNKLLLSTFSQVTEYGENHFSKEVTKIILGSGNSIGLGNKARRSLFGNRFRIMGYNVKQQFLRLLTRFKLLKGQPDVDHFFPFSIKNDK